MLSSVVSAGLESSFWGRLIARLTSSIEGLGRTQASMIPCTSQHPSSWELYFQCPIMTTCAWAASRQLRTSQCRSTQLDLSCVTQPWSDRPVLARRALSRRCCRASCAVGGVVPTFLSSILMGNTHGRWRSLRQFAACLAPTPSNFVFRIGHYQPGKFCGYSPHRCQALLQQIGSLNSSVRLAANSL